MGVYCCPLSVCPRLFANFYILVGFLGLLIMMEASRHKSGWWLGEEWAVNEDEGIFKKGLCTWPDDVYVDSGCGAFLNPTLGYMPGVNILKFTT